MCVVIDGDWCGYVVRPGKKGGEGKEGRGRKRREGKEKKGGEGNEGKGILLRGLPSRSRGSALGSRGGL
ncbi:predicted protein [Sclerotinia sclerotiorum 1980 UF-70]|uniref:Uncharacterized protein n=1 Tax=Sclerotinia sclerotiorum (strain ATCC 18683 / 1980 / Ss-1) TaxID=665079 RepID=A7F758_SCLS1|nr:predicted protein [Sclerotinia sclerotiorum 1980 UF-70]EDN98579.1 predicted protein [Sclerotinia sclerotiorum 1980 UF-70]